MLCHTYCSRHFKFALFLKSRNSRNERHAKISCKKVPVALLQNVSHFLIVLHSLNSHFWDYHLFSSCVLACRARQKATLLWNQSYWLQIALRSCQLVSYFSTRSPLASPLVKRTVKKRTGVKLATGTKMYRFDLPWHTLFSYHGTDIKRNAEIKHWKTKY